MLEGITILNQTEIMTMTDAYVIWTLCLIIGGALATVVFVALGENISGWFHIGTVVAIICAALGLTMLGASIETEHTGRYQYETLIDESVSFEAVLEKYDVVEQKGKIWILEDKEKGVE